MNEDPTPPESDAFRPPRRRKLTFLELVVLIAVVSTLLGLVMPVVVQQQERRRRMGCLNNLKTLGLAMRLYSGDNSEKSPTDPGATTLGSFSLLTNAYQTSYRTWICSRDSGVVAGSPTLPFTKANLSYAYGGFGLTESVQPDTPLACDRTSGNLTGSTPYAGNKWTHKSEGGNVAFADGHVSFQKTFVPPMYRGKNP